jgi:hypothetical protein
MMQSEQRMAGNLAVPHSQDDKNGRPFVARRRIWSIRSAVLGWLLISCLDAPLRSAGFPAQARPEAEIAADQFREFTLGRNGFEPAPNLKAALAAARSLRSDGSWADPDTPKKDLTRIVFTLWLDHGDAPRNANYAYVVVPAGGTAAATVATSVKVGP